MHCQLLTCQEAFIFSRQKKEKEPASASASTTSRARPPLQSPKRLSTLGTPLLSTLSYFTEPVRYTTSALFRRLSEDEAPTPLAKALSANYNGSMTDPPLGVCHPPMRKRSPYQAPPLTPLTLEGYRSSTSSKAKVLRKAVAEEIRLLIPPRLQLQDQWHLLYSIDQNGSTLSTLYSLCEAYRGQRGGFVVVVRDGSGGVFGAYLSDAPRPQPHYYGNGECFLWRAFVLPALEEDWLKNLPPPPSEDTTHAQRMTTIGAGSRRTNGSTTSLALPANGSANGSATPERIRFKAFPYTGENDFTIFCQQDYLSVGGGDGHYGLWLDQGLGNGVSATCLTFGNEPLSEDGGPKGKFDVMGVELWYVGS